MHVLRHRCALAILIAGLLALAPVHAAQKHHKAKSQATHTAAPHAATQTPPTQLAPNLSAAPNLQDISSFASAGAPNLALQFIDRDQPDFNQDAAGWLAWERERIYLYQFTKNWQAVIARVAKLPVNIGADFRQWEEMQAAAAWLQLGKGHEARLILRSLIWDAKAPPDDQTLGQLRQLVLRSYLTDKRLADAKTAVIRYRQDYPNDTGNWPLLEARLFLRTGQPQAALDVLRDNKDTDADMLRLLASLRTGAAAPDKVMEKAVHIGSNRKLPVDQRVHAWFIAAEAADAIKNPVAHIQALQNGLGLQPGLIDTDPVFSITPDMLWDAYVSYGEDLGNQLQLIVGDDQSWYLAASNRFDSNPVRACALFSVVAFNAPNVQQQGVAHWQFASLIQKQKNGGVVLRHLYLDSNRFKTVDSIPPDVRYILVTDVLAIPDIPLASKLMQGLDQPPPDTDPVAWQLQRARVFILGGQPDAGIETLKALFASGAPVDPGDVLPVLFDLQTIGRNQDAIPFFVALLHANLTTEQQRQLLFWIADSYKGLGDYAQAAELYLRSATLVDPYAMDQWAQSARYQAAQMLAKAGFLDDAHNLYQGLLNATHDPGQQAMLRHDLQQLMLLPRSKSADKP
ncbi:MAG: tetratricopeptide repeat protein [Gammaproteobacteria bacterium]